MLRLESPIANAIRYNLRTPIRSPNMKKAKAPMPSMPLRSTPSKNLLTDLMASSCLDSPYK